MLPDRLRRRERVADAARLREQFAALLLVRRQVHAADGHARLVFAVEREHERRHDQAEREQHDDAERHEALADLRFGVQRLARPARAAAHRDEERPEPEQDPDSRIT